MYSEKVMDHFNNPRNMGEIENPSGVGTVGNAKCGDITEISMVSGRIAFSNASGETFPSSSGSR